MRKAWSLFITLSLIFSSTFEALAIMPQQSQYGVELGASAGVYVGAGSGAQLAMPQCSGYAQSGVNEGGEAPELDRIASRIDQIDEMIADAEDDIDEDEWSETYETLQKYFKVEAISFMVRHSIHHRGPGSYGDICGDGTNSLRREELQRVNEDTAVGMMKLEDLIQKNQKAKDVLAWLDLIQKPAVAKVTKNVSRSIASVHDCPVGQENTVYYEGSCNTANCVQVTKESTTRVDDFFCRPRQQAVNCTGANMRPHQTDGTKCECVTDNDHTPRDPAYAGCPAPATMATCTGPRLEPLNATQCKCVGDATNAPRATDYASCPAPVTMATCTGPRLEPLNATQCKCVGDATNTPRATDYATCPAPQQSAPTGEDMAPFCDPNTPSDHTRVNRFFQERGDMRAEQLCSASGSETRWHTDARQFSNQSNVRECIRAVNRIRDLRRTREARERASCLEDYIDELEEVYEECAEEPSRRNCRVPRSSCPGVRGGDSASTRTRQSRCDNRAEPCGGRDPADGRGTFWPTMGIVGVGIAGIAGELVNAHYRRSLGYPSNINAWDIASGSMNALVALNNPCAAAILGGGASGYPPGYYPGGQPPYNQYPGANPYGQCMPMGNGACMPYPGGPGGPGGGYMDPNQLAMEIQRLQQMQQGMQLMGALGGQINQTFAQCMAMAQQYGLNPGSCYPSGGGIPGGGYPYPGGGYPGSGYPGGPGSGCGGLNVGGQCTLPYPGYQSGVSGVPILNVNAGAGVNYGGSLTGYTGR